MNELRKIYFSMQATLFPMLEEEKLLKLPPSKQICVTPPQVEGFLFQLSGQEEPQHDVSPGACRRPFPLLRPKNTAKRFPVLFPCKTPTVTAGNLYRPNTTHNDFPQEISGSGFIFTLKYS